jgi:hypothetical protein
MNMQRCGTCHFAKMMPQDFTARVCYGAPPTPGLTPQANGQMAMRMTRPIVKVSEEACALYRAKDADDTARDIAALQAIKHVPANGNPPETKQ